MGMNYIHFANTFSKNQELLIKGCIYHNCMEYAEVAEKIDSRIMHLYVEEAYKRYERHDKMCPFELGDAIWHAFYDYTEWKGNPDDNPIDIFDIENTLTTYFNLMREMW